MPSVISCSIFGSGMGLVAAFTTGNPFRGHICWKLVRIGRDLTALKGLSEKGHRHRSICVDSMASVYNELFSLCARYRAPSAKSP